MPRPPLPLPPRPEKPGHVLPGYVLRGADGLARRWVRGVVCPAADDAATIFPTPGQALELARAHGLRGMTTERNTKKRTNHL